MLRFRVPDGETVVDDVIRGAVTFEHENLEDFVLLRGNGTPLFVLANVVDDIEMGITHVVRGEEHLPNTPKQQLLWSAWAWTRRSGHTSRCSSTRPARSCRSVATRSPSSRTATTGYLAEAMVNYLMTLGWAPRSSGHRQIRRLRSRRRSASSRRSCRGR